MSASERRVYLPRDIAVEPRGGPARNNHVFRADGKTMGTYWSLQAVLRGDRGGPEDRAYWAHLVEGLEAHLDLVIRQMSPYEPSSELYRFNRAPGGRWVTVSRELIYVLSFALEIAELTGGIYDPTAGAAVDRWGFGPEVWQALPDEAEIQSLRSQGDWRRLQVERQQRRIFQPGGLRLDLCSLAKGFAVDLVCHFLEECGVASYLFEIGGELKGKGCKPDGQPWWVELENPPNAASKNALGPAPVAALCDLAVATSGVYRIGYQKNGAYYHHLIDARTMSPSAVEVVSAAVLHRSCMVADAWATALCLMPAAESMRTAERRGLAARLVVAGPEGLLALESPALAELAEEP